MSGDLLIFVVAGLAFLSLAGLGFALTGGSGDTAARRARQLAVPDSAARVAKLCEEVADGR